MKQRKRRYLIVGANCDCAFELRAIRKDVRRFFGPRCQSCGKVLGWMQWDIQGEMSATGELDALQKWHALSRDDQKRIRDHVRDQG